MHCLIIFVKDNDFLATSSFNGWKQFGIGFWRMRRTQNLAHLDFSEAHHPNFERLMLNSLSSVGQAAPHIN